MSVSVVIPHFFTERESNLILIAEALRHGTHVPAEVIIWNNDVPLGIDLPGVDVIQAHRNVGCQGRFIAAYTTRADYVLFHDNDVIIKSQTVENLLRWEKRLGGLVSMDGRVIPSNGRYTRSKLFTSGPSLTDPVEVTMTLGHVELIRRDVLHRVLSYFPFKEETEMEDLWFSHALHLAGVVKHVVPASSEEMFGSLPMYGVGSCLTAGHYQKRDMISKELFANE